jgi:hypothetical protein
MTLYDKVARVECSLAKLVTRFEKKTGDKDRFSSISFSDAIKNERIVNIYSGTEKSANKK